MALLMSSHNCNMFSWEIMDFRYSSECQSYLELRFLSSRHSRHSIGKLLISFLFLDENICCGYSLEAPRRGASNEYHNICFHWEIRKILCGYPLLSVALIQIKCFSSYTRNRILCNAFQCFYLKQCFSLCFILLLLEVQDFEECLLENLGEYVEEKKGPIDSPG